MLGPTTVRIKRRERRGIVGYNNEALIQELAIIGRVIWPEQERHGAVAGTTQASPPLATARRRRRRWWNQRNNGVG